MLRFSQTIQVKASAIDSLSHVNNVTYLQWIQDIAEKHWLNSTQEETRKNLIWVVVSHFIEYKSPAFENEILILTTWVENYKGVTSERHTEITRKSDHKLIVKSKTIWCLLDKTTKKPLRISPALKAIFP